MADAREGAYTAEEEVRVKAIHAEHAFLGHPRGVGTLSFMTMFNSIANYSMGAVLIYYLYATVAEGGLGFSETEAAQLVSLYWAVSGLAGLVGSYVADRVLGPRAAVRVAKCVGAAGYVFLAIRPLGVAGYALSQLLLLCSAMIQGRAQGALMAGLYDEDDPRRDGAWSIDYVINNVGAAIPVVAGTIALMWGYEAAFAIAAASAIIGTSIYIVTERRFFGPIAVRPGDPLPANKKVGFIVRLVVIILAFAGVLAGLLVSGTISIKQFSTFGSTITIIIPFFYLAYIVKSKKVTKAESVAAAAILPMFIANCFTQLVWNQGTTILSIYAETTVDRNLFGLEFTPAAFQTVPAVLGAVFGVVATFLWTKLGTRQPSAPAKFGIGTFLWGLGPVFMCLPFVLFPAGVKVSPLWLIAFYVIIIAGEALTNATGYSTASAIAPKAFASQMITVWGLSQSAGAGLTTVFVNFYHEGSEVPYFLVIGGVTIAIGVALLVFAKPLTRRLGLELASDQER